MLTNSTETLQGSGQEYDIFSLSVNRTVRTKISRSSTKLLD
jgi:hypothetical protein